MARNYGWHALLLVLAAGVGAALSVESWRHYSAQNERAEAAQTEMRLAEAERTRLMRQQTRLESPIGREEGARKLGYRRANERPLEPSRQ